MLLQILETWDSVNSLRLLKLRRKPPLGVNYIASKRSIQLQLEESLQHLHEACWVDCAKETEVACKAGNSRQLFQLIRLTRSHQKEVSEHLKEVDKISKTATDRRMKRLIDFFDSQFSWPSMSAPAFQVTLIRT